MRKNLLALVFLVGGITSTYSQKWKVSSAEVEFRSEAPLELIIASTQNVKGVLDFDKRQFAFIIPVSSFDGFNSPLQREHFNENYLETGKYPNAKFYGNIVGEFDANSNGDYEVKAIGTFDIHGVIQNREIKSIISVTSKGINISSSFLIPLEDHNIKIPTIVYQKIAEVIKVEMRAELTPI